MYLHVHDALLLQIVTIVEKYLVETLDEEDNWWSYLEIADRFNMRFLRNRALVVGSQSDDIYSGIAQLEKDELKKMVLEYVQKMTRAVEVISSESLLSK